MSSQSAHSTHPRLFLDPHHPIRSLSTAFWIWKALLIGIVVYCPGPGYDTSTGLLPYQLPGAPISSPQSDSHTSCSVFLKFVRWDAIYFVHTAEHGYVFEQEWAFGYGYSRILSLLYSVLHQFNGLSGVTGIAIVAVALSHVAHFLSVLALYRLSANIFGQKTTAQRLICFLSAALHIICPAGAFLSAPYGEALFSFLNITGFYVYSSSLLDDSAGRKVTSAAKLLITSVLFSTATTIRSNGILSGFVFACDAVSLFQKILLQGPSKDTCLRFSVTVIGGCVVALGMIIPQAVAYADFCLDLPTPRPWCGNLIPSIYGWVQSHYWNVGFLRYWTASNLPLFLLAIPMLLTLCRSSIWALKEAWLHSSQADQPASSALSASLLTRLAVPQGLLAVLAFTSYHVQIINRICSGYPLWYWYLASQLVGYRREPRGENKSYRGLAIQVMVAYALFQAILFGSFLPPA
ncbi:DUF409 domain protein [Aspergillus floccosus]